jgi:hypothetical protein
MRVVAFSRLGNHDLIAGTVYEGGRVGNSSDDPLARILKGGNAGSFRYCGSVEDLNYLVIILSLDDPIWGDSLDLDSGTITCFGDNRLPGRSLLDTPKNGNLILKALFGSLRSPKDPRKAISPTFVFCKHPNQASPRSVRFVGIAAPGSPNILPEKSLKRVQRRINSQRLRNYQAVFTILDIPTISRVWIDDLEAGQKNSKHRPIVWNMWQKSGLYRPLKLKRPQVFPTVKDQLPKRTDRKAMLLKLYRYFCTEPYQFLHFAAELYARSDPRIILERVRRVAPDHYNVITGKYRLGIDNCPTFLRFVIDAKCYNPGTGNRKRKSVGEKDIWKLLSRLGRRQYTVLVTTSAVTPDAHEAIQNQNHPVVVIAGTDMVNILQSIQIRTVKQLSAWLDDHFPLSKQQLIGQNRA